MADSTDVQIEQSMRAAVELLTPSPSGSLWRAFSKISLVVLTLCWLLALPLELILNRGVNKRYMSTAFFFMALVVYVIVADRLGGPDLIKISTLPRTEQIAAIKQSLETARPFNNLLALSVLGFACHYWSNRKRFATDEQGHSFDSGIPWLVYPPFAQRWMPMLGRRISHLPLLVNGLPRRPSIWMRSRLVQHWAECVRQREHSSRFPGNALGRSPLPPRCVDHRFLVGSHVARPSSRLRQPDRPKSRWSS